MKILHTSDWHLGRSLYNQKRYGEFEELLQWLYELVVSENIDLLLVSGDVFDTSSPSNRAQEMYYNFLCKTAAAGSCRGIIITGGNHDSPSFLSAPQQILKALKIHVKGAAGADAEDEVIAVRNDEGNLEMIVCAVPFLRDRDVRTSEAGEDIQERQKKLLEGIRAHYEQVASKAEELRGENNDIPIIGMGHLFAAGGKVIEDDGVRRMSVGTLSQVDAGVFPEVFDYVALGHLHSAQCVNKDKRIQYSGSLLSMGFGEAGAQKQVNILEFKGRKWSIKYHPVPVFQELRRFKGDLEQIAEFMEELKEEQSSAWVEIEYDGEEIVSALRDKIDEMISGSEIKVIKIKNQRIMDEVIGQGKVEETLDDLDEKEVFERCLQSHEVPAEDWKILKSAYEEILTSLEEADENEE